MFFILKFIYQNMVNNGWCQVSMKHLGVLLKQTGYSKTLGPKQVGRLLNVMHEHGLFERERIPKNSSYTYRPTSLGEALFWYAVKQNKGKMRIVIHSENDESNDQNKKMSCPNSKNVHSDSLYILKEIDEREQSPVCKHEGVQKLSSSPPSRDFVFATLAGMGLSISSQYYFFEQILKLGISEKLFKQAVDEFIYHAQRSLIAHKSAYFGKVLSGMHDEFKIAERERIASERKMSEIRGSRSINEIVGELCSRQANKYDCATPPSEPTEAQIGRFRNQIDDWAYMEAKSFVEAKLGPQEASNLSLIDYNNCIIGIECSLAADAMRKLRETCKTKNITDIELVEITEKITK